MISINSFINKFKNKTSFNYKNYWEERYKKGGNSGEGSYGDLAEFKSEVINNFISIHNIDAAIEFGCGDGNNLSKINYRKYLGLDISKTSIKRCINLYKNDLTKSFMFYEPLVSKNGILKADLVLCLDVLYHIIPENEFTATLNDIFESSNKYVILYTTIDDQNFERFKDTKHIKHRDIIKYLSNIKEFKIEEIIKQRYPSQSGADFIILSKINL